MMKELLKRISILLLAAIVSVSMMPMVSEASDSDWASVKESTASYVYSLFEEKPLYGSEWFAIDLARGGFDISAQPFIDYYEDIVAVVKEKQGEMSRNKYTEYSKVALAVKALGRNPEDVGGYNLLAKLYEASNVEKQGINGPIWALIALDACESGDSVKDEYIKYILESPLVLEDGGWKLSASSESMDTDITAMAVYALAPYYSKREDVKEAVDNAVKKLQETANEDGTYSETDGAAASVESTAQVAIAFSTLGIDCDDVINSMLKFRKGNGFTHITGGKIDGMATEQALTALIAYERMIKGESPIYDLSDTRKIVIAAPAKVTATASALSNERISVKWDSVSGAKGYQISFAGKNYYTASKSKVFTGLEAYKQYKIKVRAYKYVNGEKLYGPWSEEKSVKATYTAPAKPVISSLKSGKKKTLTVKWKKVSYAKGYQVAYKKKGGSYKYATTTSLSKTVKKLTSKKTYYVKVRAYKVVDGKKKYGKFSKVKTVKVK